MTNVLVITTGGTPQLVTETVFGLACPNTGVPWFPDRIILATTQEGQQIYEGQEVRGRIVPALLASDGHRGRLYDMYEQLGFADRYVVPEILVASHKDSPLSDVRSQAEVEAYAQMLLDCVFEITGDERTILHLSIAGGRKTMSFIAGQVMSICGRPQDIMSHCLISPAKLESQADFWWPGNDGRHLDESVRVDLHQIPFVKLGSHLNLREVFQERPDSYSNAVARTNRINEKDRLELDFSSRSVRIGQDAVQLQNKRFSVVALVAIAAKLGVPVGPVRIARDGQNRAVGSFDGDTGYFGFVWAACRALCELHLVNSGARELSEVRKDFRQNSDPDYSDFSSAFTNTRKDLMDEFSRATVDMIIDRPVRNGELRTWFNAEKIDINFPEGYSLSLFTKRDPDFLIDV